MVIRDRVLAYLISAILTFTGTAVGILTTLLYDSINPVPPQDQNFTFIIPVTILPARPVWQKIDPVIQISIAMAVDTTVVGCALLVIILFYPDRITDRERKFPKRYLVIVGVTQSASALMFQYSSPGSRTAPYLRPLLGNFNVPIMFILRFLILQHRPTLRKGLCALAIVLAGLMSLMPTFVPGLEPNWQQVREGGATGSWRIIWPLIFVGCSIPEAVSKITLEKAVKLTTRSLESDRFSSQNTLTEPRDVHVQYGSTQSTSAELISQDQSNQSFIHQSKEAAQNQPDSSQKRLNMIYMLFWTYLATFLGVVAFFWVDLIPVFGMQRDIKQFIPQLVFNFQCIFGQSIVCGAAPIALAWARIVFRTSTFILSAFLLRYGEGANFYSLVARIPMPFVFMFWTLFEEHPFCWNPEVHLSTWLSISAILIMLPALFIYEKGAPEVSKQKNTINNITYISPEFSATEHSQLLQDQQRHQRIPA